MPKKELPDTPVDIQGYITDPKFVGYQILTNYENTYWLRLVGRDAWVLYLVLRSFCHHGNGTCRPSIKLLMQILGVSDRRRLIGRVDTTPGKERALPGFIDALQEYDLVTAELVGEGPMQRYVFHVNLTPPLLTSEQVETLPQPMQKKHAQLLKKVTEEAIKLEQLKAAPPVNVKKTIRPNPSPDGKNGSSPGGGGTVPPPPGTVPPPSGTVPPKQYPINNTHITTTTRAREDHSNNNSAPNTDKDAVVVALSDLGLAKKVAQELAKDHNPEYISEKIDYLQFLLDERPDQVKNPRGWLRSAIDEDYGAPDGFVTAEERQHQVEAEQRRQQEEEADRQAALEAADAIQKAKATQRAENEQRLAAEWGTDAEDRKLWEQVKLFLTHSNFSPMFLPVIRLLKLDGDIAKIGVDNDFLAKQLSHPGTLKQLERAFKSQLKQAVEIELIVVNEIINQSNHG